MFNAFKTDEERGQVGIGTLIVFIALVLVAAIAAGVLINTAGFLQTQAEQTGEESTDQVANNIQLVTATGEADEDQFVESIEFTVQLAPGSDPVRLFDGDEDEDAVDVEVFSPDLDSDDFAGDGFFDGADEVLEEGETATGEFDAAEQLQAGNEAEIVITTEDGSQVTFLIGAPDPIDPEDDGDEVRLDT